MTLTNEVSCIVAHQFVRKPSGSFFVLGRGDDSAALADGDDLVCLYLREAFNLLRGGPLDFDQVGGLRFA